MQMLYNTSDEFTGFFERLFNSTHPDNSGLFCIYYLLPGTSFKIHYQSGR